MEIIFKRRLTNEAMMTFFPSMLLITISYTTSFFKLPNFFNTAITVNVTVMLTTTTLLISVVKKLAHTSYIKWIEWWLIFAMLIPFTQVILITGKEWSQELERKKDAGGKEDDCDMTRSKEHVWLDVNNKLVKVKNARSKCFSDVQQVHPLVPSPPQAPKRQSLDVAGVISVIGGESVSVSV